MDVECVRRAVIRSTRTFIHIRYSCNEIGFFQGGAPLYWPTIVTRFLDVDYDVVRIINLNAYSLQVLTFES